jgi:LytS/YehU family sensor histidine kinase
VNGGEINISSCLTEAGLEIRIENSGVLGNLNADGFGILNTRQRLELIYNEKAGFQIEQKNPETVSALITIPTK